jgi:hypothetical protein
MRFLVCVEGPVKPRWESELSLEEVFAKLGLGEEHAAAFTSLGITITELEACTEDDLKVGDLFLL